MVKKSLRTFLIIFGLTVSVTKAFSGTTPWDELINETEPQIQQYYLVDSNQYTGCCGPKTLPRWMREDGIESFKYRYAEPGTFQEREGYELLQELVKKHWNEEFGDLKNPQGEQTLGGLTPTLLSITIEQEDIDNPAWGLNQTELGSTRQFYDVPLTIKCLVKSPSWSGALGRAGQNTYNKHKKLFAERLERQLRPYAVHSMGRRKAACTLL